MEIHTWDVCAGILTESDQRSNASEQRVYTLYKQTCVIWSFLLHFAMIFFVRSLGCLISPSKSALNYSCVLQCPLQYTAWPHSHGTVETTCFVYLGPLSVLVFTTEFRTVFLNLSVWRWLHFMQLITTQLPTVSCHGLPIWAHYYTQHPSREHLHNTVCRLRADCSPLSTCILYGCLQRVTIPEAVVIQFVLLRMSSVLLETCLGS